MQADVPTMPNFLSLSPLPPASLIFTAHAPPLSPPPPAGTLAHYRNWAAQLQARYQLFNPDAARPAKRV